MYEDYDPYESRSRPNPYPIYRVLRDERPVHYAPGSKSYCVSRYSDVEYVFRHPEVFSSKTSMNLAGGEQGLVRNLTTAARFAWQMKVGFRTLRTSRMLIQEDGDAHAVMRAFVNRGFTPRSISRLEQRIGSIVGDCMQQMKGRDSFDLMTELNVPLPVTVIAEMLGVEAERQREFKIWSDDLIESTSKPDRGRASKKLVQTMADMKNYLQPIIEARRQSPTDDLISTLVETEGEGALSDFEVFFFVVLLLVAGNETTTNLLGNAVDALLVNPDQLKRVAVDLARVPAAIEETLRWDSPVQAITRRCTRDFELAGTRIPAGGRVMVLLGSANRDERRFPDPDRFDLDRDTRGHLAFGIGKHFCLGASLARLEARVALTALIPELPQLARVRPDPEFIDSAVIRGRSTLELRKAC